MTTTDQLQLACICSVMETNSEQTYMACFESIRKTPGSRRNKQLLIVHKQLQRQCEQTIQQHQFDVRVSTADLRRRRTMYEARLERVKRDQERYRKQMERTHSFLDESKEFHTELRRSMTEMEREAEEVDEKLGIDELIKAVENLAIPAITKRSLQQQITLMYT